MSKAATAGAYRHRRILNAELAVLYILAGLGLGLTVPRIRRGPDLPAQQVIGVLTTIGLGVLAWSPSSFRWGSWSDGGRPRTTARA
ncbi:hypothetical protein SIM91_19245 [Rhodococcus opacus]|uniref:hypothetical protein n=1 Tax=Rhodococcus opacus TaxID=37919 RepID=UPI0007CD93AE|nr:hypothetical protein [Rhodococcus opacus]MDX5965386.1 hypothetical protein [Rhodococcus opacus]CAG7579886.1 hypothetical protein E143388_00075 [Rhodococcus opacus]